MYKNITRASKGTPKTASFYAKRYVVCDAKTILSRLNS